MNALTRQHGLTIVELCTVVAIFSLMLTMATVAMSPIIAAERSRSAVNELYRGFQVARSAAIRRSEIVTICPLNESGDCTADWGNPISVFTDPNNNRSLDNNEAIVHQIPAPDGGRIEVAPRNRRYFQFGQLGSARGTLGNLTFCPSNQTDRQHIRQLALNIAGRLRHAEDTDGDGVVERSDGRAVTCPAI